MSFDRHEELFTHVKPRFCDPRERHRQAVKSKGVAKPVPLTPLQSRAKQFLLDTLDHAQLLQKRQRPSSRKKSKGSDTANPSLPDEAETVKTTIAELAYKLLAMVDQYPLLLLGKEDIDEIQTWITQQDRLVHQKQRKSLAEGKRNCVDFADWIAEAPYYGCMFTPVTYCFTPTNLGTELKITNSGTKNTLDLSHCEKW